MSGTVTIIKTIPLDGTKNGVVSVSKVDDPYGAGSSSVASIGISLSGDAENPEWKTHIPLANLQEVIEALQTLQ